MINQRLLLGLFSHYCTVLKLFYSKEEKDSIYFECGLTPFTERQFTNSTMKVLAVIYFLMTMDRLMSSSNAFWDPCKYGKSL